MVRKEDLDFYCSFPRKELQSLCKRYNLPANRSSMDMAESLASYVERNGLSSGAFGVGGIQGGSATASGAPASVPGDAKQDYDGSNLNIIREDHSQTTTAGDSGDKTHNQDVRGASIESASAPQFTRILNEKGPTENSRKNFLRGTDCWLETQTREVNAGERPQETPPGCSTSTYSSPSSFEFHVSSEKGISLSVDLNFNPSDWINSMRNEVCILNSMHPKKSRSSDQGAGYLTERKKQKSLSPSNANSGRCKGGHAVKEASISPHMKDKSQTPSDHQSIGEESLTSSAIEPCSRKRDGSDKYKKAEGHKLFIPEPSAPGLIVSCAESCSKSCCVVSLDSDCVNSPGKKMASDSVAQENLSGELLPTQKVGKPITETPISPGGGGSEMSSLEAKHYRLNPSCSPCKISSSPNYSESKLIKDTESKGCSKLIFQYNAGKNCLASNVV